MATRERITAAIQEYCRAETEKDKPAWLALFAENVVHEDPVGNRPNKGLEMVSAFWDGFQPLNLELRLTAPVIVCGNEAVAVMACKAGPSDARMEVAPIIDHFVFDDAGKITSVRAFYEH